MTAPATTPKQPIGDSGPFVSCPLSPTKVLFQKEHVGRIFDAEGSAQFGKLKELSSVQGLYSRRACGVLYDALDRRDTPPAIRIGRRRNCALRPTQRVAVPIIGLTRLGGDALMFDDDLPIAAYSPISDRDPPSTPCSGLVEHRQSRKITLSGSFRLTLPPPTERHRRCT
jgi:hypothetical protein